MSKAQENIVKLAAKSAKLDNLDFNTVITEKRAEDMFFKSSLFEAIGQLRDHNYLDKLNIHDRFAIANLFHWLKKKKSISKDKANEIFNQIIPAFIDQSHDENANITQLIKMFQPNTEEESFSVTVFPRLKDHLNMYDLVDVIRGLDSFFNLVIQKHFDDESNYSLIKLTEFINLFDANIDEEVKSKSEMSFMLDDGDSAVQLAISEIYRAFLNACLPTYFDDFDLPAPVKNSFNLRLIVETNLTLAGELIELTYKAVKESKSVREKMDNLIQKFENGNEDEQEDAIDDMKRLMMSVVDRLELNIQVRIYSNRHNLNEANSPSNFLFEKMKQFNKEPHFTHYSLNKLFEFKASTLFSKNELLIYLKEMSETTALLKDESINVPDDEMRFFIDRVLKNTSDLESYRDLFNAFRSGIRDTERNHILHAMLQEHAMNGRHASALLSFFYAAKFEITYGNKISLVNIEEVANRLGSTYSVTRRFKIAKFIEDCIDTGKIKGQPIELLQNSGYFSLVMTNMMNQKELEYTFDQYLNMHNFFDEYNDTKPRAEFVKKLVNEKDRHIKSVVLDKFEDYINEIENNREKHEISLYAQTKVITLLTREMDSRRRDNTAKNINREEMQELIAQFCDDAKGQYDAEKETRSINIADLYMQIQHNSMRVSVVLGDVRQNYNSSVEDIKNLDNFSAVETIPVILGGIAVAHREEDLNFEKNGLLNVIKDITDRPEFYQNLIFESIDQKHGNIEVKNDMGKTRSIFHKEFDETNTMIKSFSPDKLAEIFISVILIDLLKEVSDALVSSRNMAKNSMELKTALDDIFNRSKDLLEYANKEYNRIMGIEE